MQDYEDALEEEAFPFEERAIAVHEKNLELMRGGIYNAWTQKSLARLAELMPGRYAKAEISSGYLDLIDQYSYHAPEQPVPERAPTETLDATDRRRATCRRTNSRPSNNRRTYPGVANAITQ